MSFEQELLAYTCRFGKYSDVAARSEKIHYAILSQSPQLEKMNPVFRETIYNISQRLARISEGNINEEKQWKDIAFYALLAMQYIKDLKESRIPKGKSSPTEPHNTGEINMDEFAEAVSEILENEK